MGNRYGHGEPGGLLIVVMRLFWMRRGGGGMGGVMQNSLPGFHDRLIEASIETVREYEPSDGYYGCFSGGKDSVVLKQITRMAGVQVDWHYNVTTIDPPELLRFIREYHPEVKWERPDKPFFARMKEKCCVPTRRVRWCCEEFKERTTPVGYRMLLGIRGQESPRRAANWHTFTYHRNAKEYAVLPMLHWKDRDVWQFMRDCELPYCSLYDEGFRRLGCVGCPMAGKAGRIKQFARWPNYERAWKRAFQDVWERRTGSMQRDGRIWFGDRYFASWEEMWEWWLNDEPLPKDECDGGLF